MIGKVLFGSVLGAVIIGAMLLLSALPFTGHVEPNRIQTDAERLAELKEIQDQSIDTANPMRIQVDVDYREGESGSWFPKGEAPVLARMVADGNLPPVAERVGPEPLVLRGVEGLGKYGGDMYQLRDAGGARMTTVQLVRWSPQGYPIVPNVAKSWEVSEDGKTYTFHLRKGIKWSDGRPFTSADIAYYWNNEQLDAEVTPAGPRSELVHKGVPMQLETPDPYTVRCSFVAPYALFLERMSSLPYLCESPKHFLERFHPILGDKTLIRQIMEKHNLINENAVYAFARRDIEKPSLSPWIIRTERATPPTIYIRNPFYWAVDEAGNQLPYNDRIVVNDKSQDMLTIAAAQGEVSMQARYIRNQEYTMLMNQREQYGYQLRQFTNGDGGAWGISINLLRRVAPGDIETARKARMLADKRFRQALSLAIDRQAIVDALYAGMVKPRQIGSVSPSPFAFDDFDDPYGKFDPARANALLDACGLTARDADGYRCVPGEPALLFDMNYCSFTGEGPGEFIVDDWRRVGIKTRMRSQERTIFYVEKSAGLHDMSVWGGYGCFYPLLDPRYYFPSTHESNYAVRYGKWYAGGGFYIDDSSKVRGESPPHDDPLYLSTALYEQILETPSQVEQRALFRQILELASESCHVLTLHTPLPSLAVVKNGYRNVPRKGIFSWPFLSPSNMGPETWFWDAPPEASPRAFAELAEELTRIKSLRPLMSAPAVTSMTGNNGALGASASPPLIGTVIKWGMWVAMILMVVLVVIRSPYAARRVMMMIPTLFVISVISFIVIELPPGDAITSRIMDMQEEGGQVDEAEIQDIKNLFRVEQPAWRRYTWWMGLDWFVSYNRKDAGLLQGNMGRSMLDMQPVNQKIGDRLLFTFLISLGTILITWALALPIGVYSAVKQYSFLDYVFTVGGFLGMCIPGFLLALLMMYGSEVWFGVSVSGLLSPQYSAQSGWSIPKVIDLLKHIWLPILVMGIDGTAGMIRVMRANLLDELKKPYVVTARAKGVRPLKLLLKYPVRVSLNPFISGIGGLLPQLISGGAIVSIVMSLPTIGPMQLDAVMQQDMYLAGSMLMLLSTLSVIGVLLSDLLLVACDPRIRFQGGSR